MKLEELARQSSDAARAAVVHLDAPALGADARNRGRMPVLLGAAAVLLVVGLGTFLALRDDTAETVTAGSGELPVLGLADPAAFGLELAGMFDPDDMADQFGAEEFSATFVYFGAPDSDDPDADSPYADGDLLVGELVSDEPEPLSEGTTVTVRGGLQASVPGPDRALPGATTLEWYEPTDDGEVQMVLASRSLDVDQLVAVADSLDLSAGIDSVTFSDEADLPEAIRALEVVAVDDGFPMLFMFRNPDGPVVAYERAETISSTVVESVAVSSTAGTLTDSIIADRWWASSAEPIDVPGGPAWLFTYEFSGSGGDDAGGEAGEPVVRLHSVAWQWAPGVVATVSSTTSGGSELAVEASGAVVELDPALLDDVQQEGLENQAGADLDAVWGSGAGTTDIDGSSAAWAWALGLQNDQFCSSLHVGSGGSSSCEPLAQLLNRVPDAPVVVAQQEMDGLQFGVIVAGPDHIVLPAEGTPGELTEVLVPNDADGTRLLVWVGPADAPARFDALVDGRDPVVLDLGDGIAETMAPPVAEEAMPTPTAVEEEAIGVEIDVASHPSAQSMGIADDFSVEASGGNGRVFWVIGTHEGESYIVADGEATFAALLPDDVTVLKPTELPDGTVWTYVVARDVPECVTLTGLISSENSTAADETTGGPGLVVWPIEGTADGWSLMFGRGELLVEIQLQLPDIEGSVPWPEDLCGDAATADGQALSLADLDQLNAAGFAAMADDGLIVDTGAIPEGYVYSHVIGAGEFVNHEFVATDGSRGRLAIGRSPATGDPSAGYSSDRMEVIQRDGREFLLWTLDDFRPRQAFAREVVDDVFLEIEASGPARNLAADLLSAVSYDPTIDIEDGSLPSAGRATAALAGLTLDEAHLVAIAEGWRLETSQVDGVRLAQTDDEQPNRVNLVVADGRIIGVESIG